MKKRYAALGAVLAAALLLAACEDMAPPEKPETPEDALTAYLADWQRLDYAAMYERLSSERKATVSEAQFAERYANIYEGIDASKLVVTPESPPPTASSNAASPEDEDTAELAFRLSMETSAGPIRFEQRAKLVREIANAEEGKDKRWTIAWDPSLIFPGMSEGDKVRVQSTNGERGEIVDQGGNGLAVNGTALQLGLVPGKLDADPEPELAKLAGLLNIEVRDIRKKLGAAWVKPNLFVPIALVPDGDVDLYAELAGVAFQKKKLRVYPYAEAAAHLVGYIGEINAEQLERLKDKGYASGDSVGKAGLEQVFEERLRGRRGARIVIADADGKEKQVLAEKKPEPGETIRLTIDAELQRTIYEQLKQEKASAAAIDPVSGRILALVSAPAYDPNAFVRGVSQTQYDEWSGDPRQPFLNRFTKSYVPGSAFKAITAAIGLDAGTLDPAEEKPIQGLNWTKDASWGRYYVARVHDVSPVDLQAALTYSDNIYFAQTILDIGRERFVDAAAKFGFGEELPLPYPFRKSQLSNDGIGGEIQLADTGYGQGEVLMTPLHVALVYSALTNEGNLVYPYLTEEDAAAGPAVWKERAMTPETAELLKRDLVSAVSDPNGVGHGAAVAGKRIAGKTGTAELKLTKGGEGSEYGWFVGFDAADPRLLLAVMVEDVRGRGGSAYVTPMVKRIFEQGGTE